MLYFIPVTLLKVSLNTNKTGHHVLRYTWHIVESVETFLGYFVWKIMILRQKIIFFPIVEGGAKFWGISCEKSRFYTKK